MNLQTASRDSGFTIIEIVIVLGLLAVIGTAGFFFDLDAFRRNSFREDRDILVSVLQHARAKSMANICQGGNCKDGKPHGVYIDSSAIIIFQGTSYSTRDESEDQEFELGYKTNIECAPCDCTVAFEQISGNSIGCEITLTEKTGFHSSIITIGEAGQISWTN